jgi:hypothetical protein
MPSTRRPRARSRSAAAWASARSHHVAGSVERALRPVPWMGTLVAFPFLSVEYQSTKRAPWAASSATAGMSGRAFIPPASA